MASFRSRACIASFYIAKLKDPCKSNKTYFATRSLQIKLKLKVVATRENEN
jgi:hypothetical protein